ncbi:hypothetical protein Q4E93_28575 [Flavitalea sp. BT771]|uniref:hypothetical protein n=1 Tax=Flavitalea sp. BT771 TaxID=3063329 RepID=UPI0026E32032|nr:hypothetical protein [Flavitalea sp. BT771]MDO6434600.1 hypothetical protein [Flavitalea sp. BT771]MDV6223500.1 hypothetical protein [Flavitalea sp. BT771]
MIEKTKGNLNELLTAMSEEKMDLACEMQESKNSRAWEWSVADSKSWSQSWSQSWNK